MKIFDSLLAKIAPYDCLFCDEEGALVCRNCLSKLGTKVPSRCFRCMKQTTDYKVCPSCRSTIPLSSVFMKYVYTAGVKQLIKEFKFNGRRAAAKEIALLMKDSLAINQNMILVHIPTATERIRERGYDHARLLAKELSNATGLKHYSLLTRVSHGRQVGAGRSERFKRMLGAFRLSGNTHLIEDAHVVLVDDVVTTGATLSEAAKLLRYAGAKKVDAVVFAQTVQD